MALPFGVLSKLRKLGDRLRTRKRYSAAGRVFRFLTRNSDKYWVAYGWRGLGQTLSDAGDETGAIAAYRRCVELAENWSSGSAAEELATILAEQGDEAGAIEAYYSARKLGNTFGDDDLARLLKKRGDHAAVRALEASSDIEQHLTAALAESDHNISFHHLGKFKSYVFRALGREEFVELVTWTLVDHEEWSRTPLGFLILTNQRLLLLDNFFYPNGYYGSQPPEYVHLAVDRADIVNCKRLGKKDSPSGITFLPNLPKLRFRIRSGDDSVTMLAAFSPNRCDGWLRAVRGTRAAD